jgi:hypothetical protein
MALPCPVLHRTAASPWRAVEAELDAWHAEGRRASFWWRDDDAVAPSAALDRLLRLAGDLPLTLAVIPRDAGPDLAWHLLDRPAVTIAQHGIAHENHAPAGLKRVELGGDAAPAGLLQALDEARQRLLQLFGATLLPVLVPPWNRIAPELVAALAARGFAGLSTFGPRPARHAAPGLLYINTHIDPVDWRIRCRRPAAEIAAALTGQLAARRAGIMPADEPIGLLTHHRLDVRAIEAMVAALVEILACHPAVRWIGLAEALAG